MYSKKKRDLTYMDLQQMQILLHFPVELQKVVRIYEFVVLCAELEDLVL